MSIVREAREPVMILYKVGLQSGAAALTSKIDNVRAFLNGEPAGRYEIEALTRRSLWMSLRWSERWGCAIKHDDGEVEFELADGSRHASPRLVN
jgi:hypothetical protein